MIAWVQAYLAEDATEAGEVVAALAEAGIETQLESAVVHHPSGTDAAPVKVLVPEESLEDALAAIEDLAGADADA
jgi:hypothetical protein